MYFTSEIRKKGFLVPSIAYLLIYLINCIIIFLLCFCNEYALRMQTVEMASAGFYIG